jgi:pimeloyl-ACP methyl ester carboxylesterase
MKWFIRIMWGVLITLFVLLCWGVRFDIPIEKLKAKYANAHSRFVEIEGMQVHYRIEGKGMPLVLLHGTGASLHTWDKWVEALKPHYQVIRLDLPAFGLTGAHPQHAYTGKDYVRVLHSFLEKINIDSCYLGGNSLGGYVSWQYTLAYPAQVKKLLLIDAAGYPNSNPKPWVFWAARTPILNQVLQYITPEFVFRNNLQQVYEDDSKITDSLVTRYYELGLRAGNRPAFVARCKVEPDENYKKMSQIKIPVLIQWGEKDTWIPVSHTQLFQKDLPQATTIIYPKVGHIPMEELPEKTVQDFLKWAKKE